MVKLFLFNILLTITLYFNGCIHYDIFETIATDEEMIHKYILENIGDTSYTQKSLFEKSMLWVAKSWKNTYSIIDYKDKDAGQIMIKGFISDAIEVNDLRDFGSTYYFSISYKLIILTKLNKICVEFVQVYPAQNFNNGKWETLDEFYNSKVLHRKAKKFFDEYIKDFNLHIRSNNY